MRLAARARSPVKAVQRQKVHCCCCCLASLGLARQWPRVGQRARKEKRGEGKSSLITRTLCLDSLAERQVVSSARLGSARLGSARLDEVVAVAVAAFSLVSAAAHLLWHSQSARAGPLIKRAPKADFVAKCRLASAIRRQHANGGAAQVVGSYLGRACRGDLLSGWWFIIAKRRTERARGQLSALSKLARRPRVVVSCARAPVRSLTLLLALTHPARRCNRPRSSCLACRESASCSPSRPRCSPTSCAAVFVCQSWAG